MSPKLALESPVFIRYVIILATLLGVAGAALAILAFGLKKNVRSIGITYRGWLIMAPLAIGAVFAGRVPFIVAIALLAGLGFKEFARATGLYKDWWMTGAVYLGIAAMAISLLIPDPRRHTPGWYGLFMTLPVYVIALILVIPIARNRTQGQLQEISLAIVGFIYFGWMFGHLGLLANSDAPYGYILYLLFAVELNDVAAFTCGKLFGRRKLRVNVSPNKTIGGSVGALCVSLILPWLLWFSFPQMGPAELLLAGLIVGVGGQLGDLSISLIKRDIGVKDMGALIPGHGGILDRIDSLIYVAPLFLHMVRWFHGQNW